MHSPDQSISDLRRQLAETGECPFTIAALALEQTQRLQVRIRQLERQLIQKIN